MRYLMARALEQPSMLLTRQVSDQPHEVTLGSFCFRSAIGTSSAAAEAPNPTLQRPRGGHTPTRTRRRPNRRSRQSHE